MNIKKLFFFILSEFFYFMNGFSVKTLNVYAMQNSQLGLPLWSRTKSQGVNWKRGQVRVTSLSNAYQIFFEAISGEGTMAV
jgi:hypothetical protein